MLLVIFSDVGRKKVVWHFCKLVSFEDKLLDYFQLVWHLLMPFGMFRAAMQRIWSIWTWKAQ